MSLMIYLVIGDWQGYNINPLKSIPVYEIGSLDFAVNKQSKA